MLREPQIPKELNFMRWIMRWTSCDECDCNAPKLDNSQIIGEWKISRTSFATIATRISILTWLHFIFDYKGDLWNKNKRENF